MSRFSCSDVGMTVSLMIADVEQAWPAGTITTWLELDHCRKPASTSLPSKAAAHESWVKVPALVGDGSRHFQDHGDGGIEQIRVT